MSPSIELPHRWPFTVALTGVVASGKTTAGGMLSALGAAVIEVIVIPYHLQRRSERHSLDTKGERILSALGSPAKLPALRRLLRVLNGRVADVPYLVLDVPPMLDSGLFQDVDRVLWVDIDQYIRLERLKTRVVFDEARAMGAQPPPANTGQGRVLAHHVIDNNGSREALRKQVHRLHKIYSWLAVRTQRKNGI